MNFGLIVILILAAIAAALVFFYMLFFLKWFLEKAGEVVEEFEYSRDERFRLSEIYDLILENAAPPIEQGRFARLINPQPARLSRMTHLSSMIRAGDSLMRRPSLNCCNVHKRAAKLRQICDMSQLEHDPCCAQSRRLMADMILCVLQLVTSYPMLHVFCDDYLSSLYQQLPYLGFQCESCPYLSYAVTDLPELCATAMAFHPPKNAKLADHD